MIEKYDIVKVDLDSKKWHTQSGFRPAIVVQSDLFNRYSPTTLIVPLTSNIKEPFPSEFIVKKSKINGLEVDSRILWSQIITIDKDYIIWKYWVLDVKYRSILNKSLKLVLDL